MGINVYFLTKNYMPMFTNICAGEVVRIETYQRHCAVVCFTANERSFAYVNMGVHNTKRAEIDRRSPLVERMLTRLYKGNPPTLLTFNTIANMNPTMLECEMSSAKDIWSSNEQ